MKNPQFSIILPIHKQSDHLKTLIGQYQEELKKLPASYELLLVSNGDDERTLQTAEGLTLEYNNLKVFHTPHAGWGRAVQLGLREAQGEIICYTNSARTSAKDLLLFLVYAYAYPTAVLKANRSIRDSVVRAAGSFLYNMQCRAIFNLNNWDINGTPKVFPRSFQKLLELKRNDDLIDLEFSLICKQQKYPLLEIPILSTKRHGGYSTTKMFSAFRMYAGAFQMRKFYKDNSSVHEEV
jgi:glycosyltransferase involved in cell wall biosynthesis